VGKKTDQLGLPQTLQQEFSLINVQIRNVNVEVVFFCYLARRGYGQAGSSEPSEGNSPAAVTAACKQGLF